MKIFHFYNRVYILCFMSLIISGCESLHAIEDQESVHLSGADQLTGEYPISGKTYKFSDILNNSPKTLDGPIVTAWLGAAAAESVANCSKFMARLGVMETGMDTLLDVTSLGTSGAGALTSIAALSAATAFLNGTRAAIDSDIYGKTAAPLIVQQIRKSYYIDIIKYITKLQANDIKQSDIGAEYASLLDIHQSCSLQIAIAAISSQQNNKPTPSPIPVNDLIKGGAKTYTLGNGQLVNVGAPAGGPPIATLAVTFGAEAPVNISPTFLSTLLTAGQATINQ